MGAALQRARNNGRRFLLSYISRGGFGRHRVIRVRDDDIACGTPVIDGAKGGRFHHAVSGILGGHDAPKGAIITNTPDALAALIR